jgi:hypothetical protein
MNSSSLTDKEQLDLLKVDYLKASDFYKYSHSVEAFDRLDEAKNAYVFFKLDQVTIL